MRATECFSCGVEHSTTHCLFCTSKQKEKKISDHRENRLHLHVFLFSKLGGGGLDLVLSKKQMCIWKSLRAHQFDLETKTNLVSYIWDQQR